MHDERYDVFLGDSDSSEEEQNTESKPGQTLLEEEEEEVREPHRYRVLLHNDDYTTMDFVVEVIKKFFKKPEEEAVRIMMRVHQLGSAVCGVFSYEIAETKVVQVTDYAKTHGFPLKCTMEEQ
jgi:ATP-dependent Clp protease adaptor protein ClpS